MYHNQGFGAWIKEVEEKEREENFWKRQGFASLEDWRRNRPRRKKRIGKHPPPQDDRTDDETLEDLHSKDRQPHRKGWGTLHQQTRQRYWRPENNNWKERRKTKYRIA